MKKIFVSCAFGLFVAAVSAQSVEIWVEGGRMSGSDCIVTFSATNTSSQTVTFVQKVNFYDRTRNLISSNDLLFENLRSGRTGSGITYVNNAYCNEISSIVDRNMWLCTINGKWNHECPISSSFPNKGVMRITQ